MNLKIFAKLIENLSKQVHEFFKHAVIAGGVLGLAVFASHNNQKFSFFGIDLSSRGIEHLLVLIAIGLLFLNVIAAFLVIISKISSEEANRNWLSLIGFAIVALATVTPLLFISLLLVKLTLNHGVIK